MNTNSEQKPEVSSSDLVGSVSAPFKRDDLRAALDFDSLSAAEKLTGQSYKEDESTVWLGMALAHEQRAVKNRLLAAANDTNSWGQTLGEWIAVVESMGFKPLLCDDIPRTQDKFRVWWADGVLLAADSYRGDTVVNASKAYFNYRGPRNAMHSCSSGFAAEVDGVAVWSGDRDAREGLRFALDQMRDQGEILSQWVKQPFLWLLHYKDTDRKDYDYKAITAARVARLPADVQAAISGCAAAALAA